MAAAEQLRHSVSASLYAVMLCCTYTAHHELERVLIFNNDHYHYAVLQNAVQPASEEHAESKSTQPLWPASAQDAEQALKMPFFDSCMSIDMGISSDPSEDDFWVDPDMWNSDSDDATDSVCSILLEGAQSCSVPVDVPQCNLNLGNMDDLFNFVGGSPTFDKLWIPAQ